MYVYTVQMSVPATVTSGPEYVKWFKGVVDSATFDKLAANAQEEQAGDSLQFYKRWQPSAGIVETVKGFSTKAEASASLKKMKDSYASVLAKPVFSKVSAADMDKLGEIESQAI